MEELVPSLFKIVLVRNSGVGNPIFFPDSFVTILIQRSDIQLVSICNKNTKN